MGRTPLFRRLRRALALAQGAGAVSIPTREYVEQRAGLRAQTRRQFLAGGAALGALASLPACTVRHPERAQTPRIAVIGAGIAGLTAAYRLARAGLKATVFDSWNRVGGRMFTARGQWRDGQLVELGGELIDSDHHAMHRLTRELGLTLDSLLEPAESRLRRDIWFFGGRAVSEVEIVEAFRAIAPRLRADSEMSERGQELRYIDELGLAAYLDSIPELDPTLRALLEVAYVGEYGREIAEQSPWNLLWLIDAESEDAFKVYGDSDEAFHVRGGNDQVTTRLAQRLSGPIELEHRLLSVRETARGHYRLAFERRGGSIREDEFDHVVLALPFTRLRDVALPASLPGDQRDIIQTLGMGQNAKLMAQFSERVWRTQHQATGSVTTDNGLQLLWETSRGMSGACGILTVFAGGRTAEQIGAGTAEAQLAPRLARIDQIFPGTGERYITGSAVRMHWPSVEHTRGSYTCYLPGQARFKGLEGKRAGKLHFCGEHTSLDHQGYMNGGAESGERVAGEILADLGLAQRSHARDAQAARRATSPA
jgi:monoamine oxidase